MPDLGVEISITGADELILRYSLGDEVADTLLTEGMQRALDYGVKNAANFPAPESEANQPPPPYYIRGTGTQYKDGTNRGESQQLGEEASWDKEISKETEGVIGTFEPIPTYAPYVHGMTSQREIHKRRQWRKVDQIARDIEEHVQDIFAEQARKLAAFLRGS